MEQTALGATDRPQRVNKMTQSTNLMERILSKEVAGGHVSCWWLGGSGFVLKTPAGAIVCLDPYLSNCVESIFGVKRAFAAPIEPHDLRADEMISTH